MEPRYLPLISGSTSLVLLAARDLRRSRVEPLEVAGGLVLCGHRLGGGLLMFQGLHSFKGFPAWG